MMQGSLGKGQMPFFMWGIATRSCWWRIRLGPFNMYWERKPYTKIVAPLTTHEQEAIARSLRRSRR